MSQGYLRNGSSGSFENSLTGLKQSEIANQYYSTENLVIGSGSEVPAERFFVFRYFVNCGLEET